MYSTQKSELRNLKMSTIFIIISVLVALYTAPTSNGQVGTLLALQWPKSFCSVSGNACKTPMQTEFKIHGLWPSPHPGPPGKTFNSSLLTPIMADLNTYWPNLILGMGNDIFWKHEWTTHGASGPFTELDYFSKTLALAKPLNVTRFLEDQGPNGIKPGNTYPSAYVAAYVAATAWHPQIKCTQGLLHEVRFCVDAQATSIIKCKYLPGQTALAGCGPGSIKFPAA